MLWLAGVIVAVAGTIMASYFDVNTKEIPNEITLGMIVTGLITCAVRIYYGFYWIMIALPLAFSFLFAWIIWRAGLFGGGDAKLIMGIVSLIPVFPDGISFIPTFFLMMAIASFIHYFIFGMVEMVRNGEGLKTVAFALLPVAAAIIVYGITKNLTPISAILTVFSLAVVADIISLLMPYRKKVLLSDELEGEMLAETIGLKNGKVIRVKEKPSLLLKIFSGHKHDVDEVIASPRYTGISKDDIEKLGHFCSGVYIFPSYPMAPIILAAVLLAIFFGNLMPCSC
ncbi:MAG: A24 family peptidase [Candidatus Thermoplasmatota archaeon]|nr:A24 family peptidase [Candidatus Thermoplasmatota archaeon]